MPATVPRVHQRAEDEAPLGEARRMGSSQHSSEGRRKNFLGREVASLPLTEGETEAQEVSVKELAVEHGSEFMPVPGLPRGSRSRREPQTAEQQLVVVDFSFPHLGKGLCGVWCPPHPPLPPVAQVEMGWNLYQTRFWKQGRVWAVVGVLLAK